MSFKVPFRDSLPANGKVTAIILNSGDVFLCLLKIRAELSNKTKFFKKNSSTSFHSPAPFACSPCTSPPERLERTVFAQFHCYTASIDEFYRDGVSLALLGYYLCTHPPRLRAAPTGGRPAPVGGPCWWAGAGHWQPGLLSILHHTLWSLVSWTEAHSTNGHSGSIPPTTDKVPCENFLLNTCRCCWPAHSSRWAPSRWARLWPNGMRPNGPNSGRQSLNFTLVEKARVGIWPQLKRPELAFGLSWLLAGVANNWRAKLGHLKKDELGEGWVRNGVTLSLYKRAPEITGTSGCTGPVLLSL